MSTYLTDKAKRRGNWKLPLFLLLVLMTGITLSVTVDFMRQGDWTTAAIGLLLLALCLWRALRMARHWLYCRRAATLAEAFEHVTEEALPLDRLQARTPLRGADKWAARLLGAQYLQNAYIDKQRSAVVFTVSSRRVEKEECVQVECPACGASGTVLRGRVSRCAYCGSMLTGQSGESA